MKKYFILLSSLFLGVNIWGQSYVDVTGANRFSSTRALDDFNNLKNVIREDEDLIENIKGSMYFNEFFQESIIIFKGNPINEKAFLRYNSYRDEIEIGKNNNQKKANSALIKDLNVGAQIGSELFQAFSLNPKKEDEISYLIQIYSDDNFKIYTQKSKKFVDEKPAPSGIGGFLPARLDDRIRLFYTSQAITKPVELKINKKSILNLFPEDEVKLKKFISEKKIKIKDHNDFLYVIENYKSN
ncbi:MAG: hypothetical protein P8J67_01165 [Flavobacteriaceae bacterium]|nr:hypothetical protein [Flavobacteriaceae bacterium]